MSMVANNMADLLHWLLIAGGKKSKRKNFDIVEVSRTMDDTFIVWTRDLEGKIETYTVSVKVMP